MNKKERKKEERKNETKKERKIERNKIKMYNPALAAWR